MSLPEVDEKALAGLKFSGRTATPPCEGYAGCSTGGSGECEVRAVGTVSVSNSEAVRRLLVDQVVVPTPISGAKRQAAVHEASSVSSLTYVTSR